MRRRWYLLLVVVAACSARAAELMISGDNHTLRTRPAGAPPSSPQRTPVLVLSLDGVSRDLLYDLLHRRELPNLAALIGDHAYFDDSLLATLPTTTMPAWVSTMTGKTPAEHGVTGNEYFIRETATFACPAPISFTSVQPTLAIYTEDYLDKLLEVPTVYELLRARDPSVLIWVAMNHIFRGADRLLLAKRRVITKALVSKLVLPPDQAQPRLFAAVDRGAIRNVVEHLDERVLPDILALYLSGPDLYAHHAPEGPDAARRMYLHDVIDPALGKLVARLRARGLLDRMWIVVVADHGMTAVVNDRAHALGASAAPREILRRAGFRVRAAKQYVPAGDPSNAVLAYGGAMAYVYLADRSLCPKATAVCPWEQPPRYREDVLAAAEAFHRANRDGPLLQGTLDMILTRRPVPFAESDVPFEVYVGDGTTVPVEDYLREHPHPTYVRFAERLRQLAVGPYGERAGDILLLAHNGDRARKEDRYYFAREHYAWHGSPSAADSEIPLIVANRQWSTDRIRELVQGVLGDEPYQWKITELMLAMRSER